MPEKRLRVGIDAGEVESFQSRMKKSAEEVMRGMIRDARAYTTSSKEVIGSIEEQIRAIEKRNKLEEDFRKQRVEEGFKGGEIGVSEKRERLSAISTEIREDRLQTQLLREIIETIKSESRKEIREDRAGIEKQIYASQTVGQLDPEGDEYQLLKETLQQQELARIRQEEGSQGIFGGGVQRFGMIPANLISARSPIDVASSAATGVGNLFKGAKGGIFGIIMAATVGALIKEFGEAARNVEASAGDYSILTGRPVSGMGGLIKDIYKRDIYRFGMTPSQYLQQVGQLGMTARTMDFGESPLNLLNIVGGTSLGMGDVAGVAGLRRYGGGTVSPITNLLERYLKTTEGTNAALPEIIQMFTTEAKNIIQQTGRINTDVLATMIAQFGGQTGLRGEALSTAFAQFQQGFMPSDNPVMQYLQLEAARGTTRGRNASWWGLQKIMTDPNDLEYKKNLLRSLKSRTGGGEMYEMALSEQLEITPNIAAQVAKFDLDKSLTKEQIRILSGKSVSYQNTHEGVTGALEKEVSRYAGAKEQMAFGKVEEMVAKFDGFIDKLEEILKANTNQYTTDIKDAFKEVMETGTTFKSVDIPASVVADWEQKNELIHELKKINDLGINVKVQY
jgi:hypothetical protein